MNINNTKPVLAVKGVGRVTIPPDLLVISIDLSIIELEYEKAMSVGTEMYSALKEAIVSAGHDTKALKTGRFNIDTYYEYENGDYQKKTFSGYKYYQSLSLEFDLDMPKLGETLSAISTCGANPQFSIKFSAKNKNAVFAELLENAVEDAKMKAQVLSNAANVRMGSIQRIDYNWSEIVLYSSTKYDTFARCSYDHSLAPLSIDFEPEDIVVSDTAMIVWEIE